MELKVSVTRKGKISEGEGPEIIRKHLLSAMHEAVAFLEREVKAGVPQGVYGAKGGLMSTIAGEIVDRGSPVMRGVVGTSSPYGEVIERGRRPGKWPPQGALIRWIEKKMGVAGKQAAGLEFVIRRKIGRKGFEGAHMFERAFSRNEGKIEQMFNRAGFEISMELSR